MNQCSECQKAANGNCGRHLESYMGSVSYQPAPAEKSIAVLIQEAVDQAVHREKMKWMEIMGAWKMGNPKNHQSCGCKKCFALGQALQKAPVYEGI